MEPKPLFIDRLTGKPYGYQDKWTVDTLREAAEDMGKKFNPSPDIADSLEEDLANGATVLFDEEEVKRGVNSGRVPKEWKKGLIKLVRDRNDIAVIPKGAVETFRDQQRLARLLTSRR